MDLPKATQGQGQLTLDEKAQRFANTTGDNIDEVHIEEQFLTSDSDSSSDEENKDLEHLKNEFGEEEDCTDNIYKHDQTVNHSLYRERNDDLGRISGNYEGVPNPDRKTKQRTFENMKDYASFKMAYHYKKLFDLLDEDNNKALNSKELCGVSRDYVYPVPYSMTVEKFVESQIDKLDESGDEELDFIQFTKFMENLWISQRHLNLKHKQEAIIKSVIAFEKIYDFIDYEKKGYITAKQIEYAFAVILSRDISKKSVKLVMQNFASKKNKISKDEFMLSMMNRELQKHIKDYANKQTFYIKPPHTA